MPIPLMGRQERKSGLPKPYSRALCPPIWLEGKDSPVLFFSGAILPLNAKFAAGNFLRDGLQGGPIRVEGDGTPIRSYLYAADLAIWLWTVLLQGEVSTVILRSGHEVSIGELAHIVVDTFAPVPEVWLAKPPQPGAPAGRYVPSTARVASELHLQPHVDLPDAVARTMRWRRGQPT